MSETRNVHFNTISSSLVVSIDDIELVSCGQTFPN